MEAAHRSAALHETENDILVSPAAVSFRLAFDLTDECFVRLDGPSRPAHRRKITRAHGLANAMRHEPCRFVSHLERAVELMRADALLARREQMRGLEPFVQRD